MWAQLGLAIGSSILGSVQEKKAVEAQNQAVADQFALNLSVTRASLDTLGMRANALSQEITRDKVYSQMAAEKAGVKAIGQRKAKAATMGTTGKRTELLVEQEVMREVGDAVTEADINAQIQQWNLQDSVNDQTTAAINNLNNSIGSVATGSSTLQQVVDMGQSLYGAYKGMDQFDQAKVQGEIKDAWGSVSDWFASS